MADTVEAKVLVDSPRRSLDAPAPLLITAAANTAKEVYNGDNEPRYGIIYIHNLASTPVRVYWNVNDIADIDADNSNDILGGGSATDDGLGSQIEFDLVKLGIRNIYLFHETSAIRCAVKKFLKPNRP